MRLAGSINLTLPGIGPSSPTPVRTETGTPVQSPETDPFLAMQTDLFGRHDVGTLLYPSPLFRIRYPDEKTETARPPLYYPGCKWDILVQLGLILPREIDGYVEPFCGTASVWSGLIYGQHRLVEGGHALLMDLGANQILVLWAIQNRPHELIKALAEGPFHNRREDFNFIVGWEPQDPVLRAARFIYLTLTGNSSAVVRFNRGRGKYNVPFAGRPRVRVVRREEILFLHQALQGVELRHGDFRELVRLLPERVQDPSRWLVYMDPPYAPLSATAGYVGYTPQGFAREDHIAAARLFRWLDSHGYQVALSNNDVPLIHDLYDGYHFHPITIYRRPGSKARTPQLREILVTNFRP